MNKPEEGVGVDLTPPSFLQRRREGEPDVGDENVVDMLSSEVEQPLTTGSEELELPAKKLATLEELIALIKSLVGQREAIDEKIRILNRHAEKMLREISKPKR